jgi:hypothetical protein
LLETLQPYVIDAGNIVDLAFRDSVLYVAMGNRGVAAIRMNLEMIE